ncbi:TerC/Alx family metal homeostasis membrane protein [Vibrio splendidus]
MSIVDEALSVSTLPSLGYPAELITVLLVAVLSSVFLDLWVHRKSTDIILKDALGWSVFWVALALAFSAYLGTRYGEGYASMFLSGYALEKTLSVDNLMVFVAVFSAFGIKNKCLEHRILYWGILGALVFRALFISAGTWLYSFGAWVELLFAGFLFYTAYLMFKGQDDDDDVDYASHWSVRWAKKVFPVVPALHGKDLIVGRKTVEQMQNDDPSLASLPKAAFYLTPAFLCLVVIEVTDIMFSFDSVPAIIAITQDPILVYSAVIFAILGLRNLYFLLAIAVQHLGKLEMWVGVILAYIGYKLSVKPINEFVAFLHEQYDTMMFTLPKPDHDASLYVVLACITLGVVHSVIDAKRNPSTDDAA